LDEAYRVHASIRFHLLMNPRARWIRPDSLAGGRSPVARRDGATIIELVGAPGAGKTTLLPAVLEACRAQGLRPFTVVEAARVLAARTVPGRVATQLLPAAVRRAALWRIFLMSSALHALRFVVKRPKLAWYVLVSQRGRPAEADVRERRVLYWYVRLMGSYEFLSSRARVGEVLVFDEGFVHRVVQLHASSMERPEPSRIDSYVQVIPRPYLVIHVAAPVAVCEQRVRTRGAWTRFHGRHPGELGRFIANAHRVTDLVVSSVRKASWPVVEIDNGEGDAARARTEATHRVGAELAKRRRC
jgi:hypothetical protein